MISIPSMIARAARLNPNGMATRDGDRKHTWQETQERIARLAGGLRNLGMTEGDRVAILSLNSDRYYELIFAIPWAGGVVVPLNTRWSLSENEYAMRDCGAQLILSDDTFGPQATSLLEAVDSLTNIIHMGDGEYPEGVPGYEQLIENSGPVEMSSRAGDDMVGIFYTGGTTGFPKGVMQSHRAIWSSAIGALPEFSMTRSSTYLHAAPMFHVADLCGTMATALCAGCNVILPSFDAGLVLRTFTEQKISHTLLVPAMIKMVLGLPEAASADLSSLECILYGASPMPRAVLEEAISTWPSVGLAQAYGQTELAPIVSMLSMAAHREGGKKLESAGRPTPVNDVRIVDENGEDCPMGATGEIVVSGPNAMLGYWNAPEQTAAALQDGWVFTGDAGYLDEEGYLYIVDRVKDMVVTGGENVFTIEVENAVISHEAIQDVAVIGVPDEKWGEAVHAVVIFHPGRSATTDEIVDHCRGQIAGYKLPKSISFRKEPLPLSGAGKVLKVGLRESWKEGNG